MAKHLRHVLVEPGVAVVGPRPQGKHLISEAGCPSLPF